MKGRKYRFGSEALTSYMKQNFLAESAIVGEIDDAYIIQRGKKVSQLSKAAVESFALEHGFIKGQGYDALSEQDKGTFINNRSKNTMAMKEAEAYQATLKDENLQEYHNQLKTTRQTNARREAHQDTVKPWKGDMSYSAGGGTNQ